MTLAEVVAAGSKSADMPYESAAVPTTIRVVFTISGDPAVCLFYVRSGKDGRWRDIASVPAACFISDKWIPN